MIIVYIFFCFPSPVISWWVFYLYLFFIATIVTFFANSHDQFMEWQPPSVHYHILLNTTLIWYMILK